MKKVLIVILVILLLVVGAMGGYAWYTTAHIFVEDAVYAKNSESLDLRGQDISLDHYEAVRAQLPNIPILWDVPFQNGTVPNDAGTIAITELAQEDIARLDYLPELTTVDASACTDYAMLEALIAARPDLDVQYQVSLGAVSYDPAISELVLSPEDFDFDTLAANLPHLSAVEKLTLRSTTLTGEQMTALRESFPDIAIDFTVSIAGQEYDSAVTELDLSGLTSEDVAEAAAKLSLFSALETVELDPAGGRSQLSKTDVKALNDAAPNVTFHYTFDFYGKTISTTDKEVKMHNVKIGDQGEAELRQVLDIMESCDRFVLEYCRFSNEVLAQVREDYRDKTKVVWRVFFGDGGSALTDVEIIRAVYGVTDSNSQDLIYCEDVLHIDLGHNETMKDISFVSGMTKLQTIVISGAPVSDLTPFSSCTDLRLLEASSCMYITDISPLAACTKLEMLNLSYASVTDLSPLDEIPLTHLTMIRNDVPDEEETRFISVHNDCWTVFKNGDQPFGRGWRYNEDDKHLEWYANNRAIFKLDYRNIPNNCGWYMADIADELPHPGWFED